MPISSLLSTGAATLIAASRLTPVFATSPVLGSFRVPMPVRAVVVLALAFVFSTALEPALTGMSESRLLTVCVSEMLVGGVLALGVHASFAAFALAGRAVDVQSGLALASVIDPVTKASGSTLSQIFTTTALALFFFSGTHLDLLRALAMSYEWVPAGSFLPDSALPELAARASQIFVYGLALAAPVMMALWLIDVGVAVTSRSMPQINVLVLATPVKALVAVTILSLTCRGWTSEGSALHLFEYFVVR
ncbi:flagellar biosynthetic protein FliR [Niveibacterium sp. COAC-50]|uniref:flagellar biosynthetic protein FliR n=1 Tax=Niveibacterium sp. COAC-50 TaxID=2729384 RepID=UPI0015519BBA|nr:flagellar biosynthetic protein FliR [Niveibacterium sp. COAC-50]